MRECVLRSGVILEGTSKEKRVKPGVGVLFFFLKCGVAGWQFLSQKQQWFLCVIVMTTLHRYSECTVLFYKIFQNVFHRIKRRLRTGW